MTKQSKIIIAITAAILVIGAVGAYSAFHKPAPSLNIEPGLLPTKYYSLQPGMTEAQVMEIAGKPLTSRQNPKYEHKSDADWDRIQAEAASQNEALESPDSVPDPRMLKLNSELEHRAKDVWAYTPSGDRWVLLSFDDHGRLLKAGAGMIRKPVTGPGGPQSAPPHAT